MRFKVLAVLVILTSIVLFLSADMRTEESDAVGNKTVALEFRRGGKILNEERFRSETQDVVFFTDSKWRHVNGEIVDFERKGNSELPAVVVPKNQGATLNFLWEVPGFGKTVLRLDLSHFKDNETVEVDRALAGQYLRELEEKYQVSEPGITGVEKYLERSRDLFEEGNYIGSLNRSLRGLEELTIQKAENKIEEGRKEEYEIKVTEPDGEPVKNATVSYELKDHDFSFGWFETPINKNLTRKIDELGFNEYNQFAFWHETEPEDSEWNFVDLKENLNRTEGFRAGISGPIGDTPSYTSELSREDLQGEIRDHVSRTVEELEEVSDVKNWECYGLGMRYDADQTLQMTVNRTKEENLESTETCIQTVKRQTNDSVVVTGWNIDGSEIRNETYDDVPYTYYQRLAERGLDFSIGFDFMYFGGAHEMYPELVEKGVYREEAVGETRKNWIPMHNLYTLSEMLDWYSTLNESIYIQYFQAPSNRAEGQQGYWHEPWNEEIQAEWVDKYYTLIYSKPYVKGINYLEVKDSEWKDLKTGILYRNGTPKKSYQALKDLLGSWASEGVLRTNPQGIATFRGYEGNYRISVESEDKVKNTTLEGREARVLME
ncbi:MAG: hypothetical protein ACLFSS_04130, partial [Candidatus Aenigmatarchaeota archaeon]